MKLPSTFSAPDPSGRSSAVSLIKFAVFGLLVLSAPLASRAAAPTAGTTIGNAASATYRDNANIERQVTSNVVVTIVQQVYSFDLVTNRAAVVAPGGQVFFPHTVTNTGNGQDTYRLSLANDGGDNFDLTNL
ncbi:MAG TPA: hypothetical protein VHF69_03665, partial [Candidatus Synoicihabitans sp.]|nr:hypothetical protein [Candidatus Synoicihabitans sp.]